MDSRRVSLRDCVVWIFIIGGHALLLMLFDRVGVRPEAGAEPEDEDRSVLFMLFASEPEAEREPEEDEERRAEKVSTRPRAVSARPDDAPGGSGSAITLPSPSAVAPEIDWFGQGADAARAQAEASMRPGPRAFGEHPKSPYRRCKQKKSSFEWNPEPDMAGFAGLLPFVRLGDRCVVGLGFFGCAIGDLPKPNSHLFDDMHDPERQKESVPGPNDCLP